MTSPLKLLPLELQPFVLEYLRVPDILNLRLAGHEGKKFVDLLHIENFILRAIRTHQRVYLCSLLGLIFPDGQSHGDFVARCRPFAARVRAQHTDFLGIVELAFTLVGEHPTRLRFSRTGALIAACGFLMDGPAEHQCITRAVLYHGLCRITPRDMDTDSYLTNTARAMFTGLESGAALARMSGLSPTEPYEFGCDLPPIKVNSYHGRDDNSHEQELRRQCRHFRKFNDGITVVQLVSTGSQLSATLAEKLLPPSIILWALGMGRHPREGHRIGVFSPSEAAFLIRIALCHHHRGSAVVLEIIQSSRLKWYGRLNENVTPDIFATLAEVSPDVWSGKRVLLRDESVVVAHSLQSGTPAPTALMSGPRAILRGIFNMSRPKAKSVTTFTCSLNPDEKRAREKRLALEDLRVREQEYSDMFRQEAAQVGFTEDDIAWVLSHAATSAPFDKDATLGACWWKRQRENAIMSLFNRV